MCCSSLSFGYPVVTKNELSQNEQSYLSDVPKLTEENLQWYLPEELWTTANDALFKGRFFTIELGSDENNWHNYLYDDPLFKKLFIEVKPGVILKEGKRVCSSNVKKDSIQNHSYSLCAKYFCEQKDFMTFKVVYFLENYFKEEENYIPQNKKCNLAPVYFHKVEGSSLVPKISHNFQFYKINEELKNVVIKIGDKTSYLDIRLCNKNGSRCYISDYKNSDYEISYSKLLSSEGRNSLELNDLVLNLLPCVKRKDIACIKKYFVTETEFNDHKRIYMRDHFIETPINNETISELEACLAYPMLLPFLNGSRGKNKICYFSKVKNLEVPKGKAKILSVDFPGCLMNPNCVRRSMDIK